MNQSIPPGRTPSDFRITLTDPGQNWVGKIEHLYSSEVAHFSGMDELIFVLHERLENMRFPQSTTAFRCWFDPGAGEAPGERGEAGLNRKANPLEKKHKGRAPTFFVRIHFRQNATWQGSIQWLEEGTSRQFRSMLEMILLMKEAVQAGGVSEVAAASWTDEEQGVS